MDEALLDKRFRQVKEAILSVERERRASGKELYRPTEIGYWGTSNVDDLFVFFSKIHLEESKHFLDMGSGDGRMVLVASLFTDATGIEIDDELIGESVRLKQRLTSLKAIDPKNCAFIHDDFMKHGFSKYDFLMAYYDKQFTLELEKKIESEFKDDFYLYNNIYLPKFLKVERIVWVAQMPFYKIALEEKGNPKKKQR